MARRRPRRPESVFDARDEVQALEKHRSAIKFMIPIGVFEHEDPVVATENVLGDLFRGAVLRGHPRAVGR